MQAQKPSRDVLLAFKDDVSIALQQVCMPDYDDEAMILSRAVKIIRRDIFNAPSSTYNGKFDKQCQQDSIPVSLATLVAMILFQPNIESQSNPYEAQATLSISQLIKFNCSARRRKGKTAIHHNIDHESPLPLYLGLLLHAKTRKRQLVDKLDDLGLSISYDRVLGISSQMVDEVFARFEAEKVVCPPNLRHDVFTMGAVDNIDHNPSSTTAQGSLHGTGISLFQHPAIDGSGKKRCEIEFDASRSKGKFTGKLPDAYGIIPPLILHKGDIFVPKVVHPLVGDGRLIAEAFHGEYR